MGADQPPARSEKGATVQQGRTRVLVAALLGLGLLTQPPVTAQTPDPGAEVNEASPGWDVQPPLTNGQVIRNTPISQGRLKVLFKLNGAKPNATYKIGFDIFDAPDPGVARFGVPRFTRLRQTREGNT